MIHNVSDVKAWHRGTEQIGDTLFVDGVPFTSCGICQAPIKQVDVFNSTGHVKIANGRKSGVIETYKVTVGHWLHEQEYTEVDGLMTIRTVSKPVIKQVAACKRCWQVQQDERLAKNKKMNDGRNDHLVMFSDKSMDKVVKKPMFKNTLSGTSKKYPY